MWKGATNAARGEFVHTSMYVEKALLLRGEVVFCFFSHKMTSFSLAYYCWIMEESSSFILISRLLTVKMQFHMITHIKTRKLSQNS